MVIESKGIHISIAPEGFPIHSFYMPPFAIENGEIVIINFPGPYLLPYVLKMVDIFTGETPMDDLKVNGHFKFAKHFSETNWKGLLFPTTVKDYIRKEANPGSDLPKKIYDEKYIKPNTKLNTLPGTPRKLLSIYAALSWTNKIIFDLAGLDRLGTLRIYQMVKDHVCGSGAAILIDGYQFNDDSCPVFVEAQLTCAATRG
jgi:hypothetical protein